MKNSAYTDMGAPEAVDMFEKIRLKAKQSIDSVKFDFDARMYLYPQKETMDYTIDSAYFSVENGPFVLYAGKQRLKWGTGNFWNPSDNLQPSKNIFRTTEDLEGIFALRGEYSNNIVTPSVILIKDSDYSGGEAYKNLNGAVQLYSLISSCDVYLNYIYKTEGYSAGAALSWDAGFAVINLEGVFNRDTPEGGALKDFKNGFTAGLTKIFSDELSAAAEYYRSNGISMPSAGLNKNDYLAYTASYIYDQKITFSVTGLNGPDDGTMYIFPCVSWMENQNFDAQISLLQNLTAKGNREGNNSTPFYSVVEIRINAYF
jgi:hypothetical protein